MKRGFVFALLAITFMVVVLPITKLFGLINLSWWLVFAPLGALGLGALVFCLIVAWAMGHLPRR